jgi:opacity protein-like surface antigen
MRNLKTNLIGGSACVLFAALAPAVAGAENFWAFADQKPAWLTEASLGLKETYDDNVFLAGADSQYLPAYTVPAGSVAALENRSSLVTTVSPKLAVNFSPLLGQRSVWQLLSLAYAPDFVLFHNQPSESYDAQRVVAGVKARSGAFAFSADDTFTYVDGNSVGPFYPGALFNANYAAAVRERREQIQDKASVNFQYDAGRFFFRPTASLLLYDMMTDLRDITGYQNYSSRYDVNGGADFGYRVWPQSAFTLGYRYGHQYQEQFSFSPYSSPSDYQRVLVGLEGKPWHWLEVKILGGPDFRQYPGDTATHITPVNDRNPVKPYGEALLVATLTGKDAVTFKFKEWEWVSSIGKIPYLESTYDLGYHRKLTDKLGLDLGGRLLSSDYTGGNISNSHRNDWDYQFTAGLSYAVNPHISVNLAYTRELGRSMADNVENDQTRAFDRDLIMLGAIVKF